MINAIAITCRGVSKSFALVEGGNAWRLIFGGGKDVPVFEALKDISFEVPKGQFVGILGRNGAGKSTLLRVIGGVYPYDTGQIAIHGALSGLYELGIVGNPELTGRQYAERLLTVHGFKATDQAAMIEDIHDFSELGDRFDDPVLTYSAGMGARLFFATATAGHYDVYLLDEILSVGDQHFQAKCWRRLRDRVSGGASGILVTHDWAAIVKLCQTAHVIDKGKIAYTGPAERAARYYLYGKQQSSGYHSGVAHFLESPSYPSRPRSADDFIIKARVKIEQSIEVKVVYVIERLQPGYGWEVALMSRHPDFVGNEPGTYQITLEIPALPLEPGQYQISLQLMMSDPEIPQRRIALDGFSWLNGNGLTIDVNGDAEQGLHLPLTWSIANA